MKLLFLPKNIVLVILILSSSLARAKDEGFATIVDCWRAMSEKPYTGFMEPVEPDLYVIPVLRYTDTGRSSGETVLEKDNFLILNNAGAQLLVPEPKVDSSEYKIYGMTIQPPGKKEAVVKHYVVYKADPNLDGPGWMDLPEGKVDPATPLDLEKSREVMSMVLRARANKNEAGIEEKKMEMGMYATLDIEKAKQGIGLSEASKEVNVGSLKYLKKSNTEALSKVDACSRLDNETIKLAGLKQKATLLKLKDFLDTIGTQPAVLEKILSQPRSGVIR